MTTTRSGATSEPGSTKGERAGSKRQLHTKSPPAPKRVKKDDDDEQQVVEDTLPSPTEAYGDGKAHILANDRKGKTPIKSEDDKDEVKSGAQSDEKMRVEKAGAGDGATSSNVLEKGIIYFFIRGRVGIDEPSGVEDIARSYIVLRPLAQDAKLGEGAIADAGNNRLIAVPKKVFPRSGRERWIAFVAKANISLETLKDEFMAGSEYSTKTVGLRHRPAATPVAEGIYAITTTGRESHLAYVITLPSDLGEVQTDLGLREKGSFIISTRNPAYDPPQGLALPRGPDYPKEVQDEFRALRWISTQPKHLDFPNTQFLLIGQLGGIRKAAEPQKEEEGHEQLLEVLVELEDEDMHRMEALQGDNSTAIFEDLQAQAEDYPRLRTTFHKGEIESEDHGERA
ncbi:hypothetical protein GGS23DRAFT_599697 [Durotheca rogersii]|uniref:uncharacterized protein n=1 Tax=Durotheca rogersii TaxID=419775 RepID=UPI00221E777C|nr:uncharacterized protein GGS23DRAFT_599697 [Durotheca rogersii]KAI5860036.1 hypothetical protein GGS23DRAFT_599697 [Durotheca rogersii]